MRFFLMQKVSLSTKENDCQQIMTMSSINKTVTFLLVFLCVLTFAFAQENLTGYWQPQIGINYKVSTNYSHNFSVAKRTFILRDSQTEFTIRQLDLVHFSNLKIQGNQSIGL